MEGVSKRGRRDGYPSFDVGTSRRDDEYHSFEFNTSGREVDEPLDVPNLTCDGYYGSDNGDGADGSDNCDGADNVGGADDSDCDGSDGSQPSDFDYSAESCEDSTDDEALDMMVEKYDVQPSVRGEQSVPNYVPEGLPFFRSLPCEGSRVMSMEEEASASPSPQGEVEDEYDSKESVLQRYFLQEWKLVKSLLDNIVSARRVSDLSAVHKIRSIVCCPNFRL
ncbi:hypothetical protein SASPL_102727 [Salvia splendens]|uniref:Uncharacterized protein n=1 Tax=Salvia splendens TaxID=180675 RepID=A0A8X8YWH3_SALSN|nr:hypothetical protein SASPL_102727 [Salvia splendens]